MTDIYTFIMQSVIQILYYVMQHLYKARYCTLIVSCSRGWVLQLGWEMLYKRKRRLVMAIAATLVQTRPATSISW